MSATSIKQGRSKLLEQLKCLVELQFLEDKKAELLRSRDEAPVGIAALEKEFAGFESEYLMKKTEYDNALKMRRTLEQEVKDLESRMARSKGRTTEVKTNREYQALLKEVEDIKKEIASREDQILEHMETIERLDQEVKVSATELAQRKKQLQADKEQLEQQCRQVDARIVNLEVVRQEVRARLEQDIGKRYDFLVEKRHGSAVAPVENGVCKTCHLNLPPQKYIELQRDEAILNCPHCQRFIYWAGNDAYGVFADDFGKI
jgi:predicted  nucleic acid-binding Zn-ribbon protein